MSTSSTITSLQQALDCAGKCDCCDKFEQQIYALKSEIAALNNKFILKSEKPQIIQASAAAAEDLIVPGLITLVGTLIYNNLIPIKAAIAALSATVQGLAGTVATVLGKVAALAAAIAALAAAIATLNILGGRIDAVENGLTALGSDVSNILGQLLGIKTTANRAEDKADKANVGVSDLFRITGAINQDLSNTKSLARTALDKAVVAERKADTAQVTAERAAEIANIGVSRANTAIEIGNRANNRLDNVEPLLDLVNQRVIDQQSEINALNNGQLRLQYEVENLSGKVNKIENQIPVISAKANQALSEATEAKTIAEIAKVTANNAQQEAEVANTKAQSAILETAKLKGKISSLEQKDVYLEREITQAELEAYAALQLGGIALGTASNVAQGLSNVEGRVGIIGGTAINADSKATNALGQISTIKNGVVSNPAAVNATPQAINQVKQKQGEIDREINDIKTQIKNPTTTGTNTKEVTRAEFEQIKQRLGEGEKVNAEGNQKLDEILGRLPYIPAATAAAVAARVPDVPAIKQAVGEATCESARNGCISGALNNQTNSLKQDFGQKLRDLEQGLNAGANAAQLSLLNTINTKIGAQVVGGITGSLGKFYDWAHIDRALNILTFAATIHNGMMLSNDIAQTLTQALGNALSVIGIKDKDGNALNISGLIGSTIENAIKGVIGAENYAQLSANFAVANRIYQSTTNVLNNFQNTTSTVLNGLEVVGSNNAKIGNALKAAGAVQENAFNWMNPQPKFNRITVKLETFQSTASTVLQVTQVPLDIASAVTELNQSTTELVSAIRNDENDNNKGVGSPEPIKLAADNTLAKTLSAGLNLSEFDLDADE